jgi:hypothetical protein
MKMKCSDNLRAIIDCINAKPQTEEHERIFRTVQYYVHAHSNADSEFNEIKLFELMALETGMEIILGGTDNRKDFLEKYLANCFRIGNL